MRAWLGFQQIAINAINSSCPISLYKTCSTLNEAEHTAPWTYCCSGCLAAQVFTLKHALHQNTKAQRVSFFITAFAKHGITDTDFWKAAAAAIEELSA